MATEVVGDTAYELVYKDDPPLTDAQARALAAEYGKLGLHCKKARWNGLNCVIAKAPSGEYKRFSKKQSERWQAIQKRVGYSGYLNSKNNTYQPGETSFTPGEDWSDVVSFINTAFSSSPNDTVESNHASDETEAGKTGRQTGTTDLTFECPHCKQHLEAGSDMAGMELACPTCNGQIIVPSVAESAPSTAPVAPKDQPSPEVSDADHEQLEGNDEHAQLLAQYIKDTAPALQQVIKNGLLLEGVMLEPTVQEELRKAWQTLRKKCPGPLNLSTLELSNCVLACADLSGADLRNARFEKVGLLHTNFTGCDLRQSRFINCPMRQSYFSEADLTGSQFVDCEIFWCHFKGTKARRVKFDLSGFGLPIIEHDEGLRADFAGSTFADCRIAEGLDNPLGKEFVDEFLSYLTQAQKAQIKRVSSIERKQESQGCFVATAASGNTNSWEVRTLSMFRDKLLRPSRSGACLTGLYYRVAPPFAELIRRRPLLQQCALRFIVRPAARAAERAIQRM